MSSRMAVAMNTESAHESACTGTAPSVQSMIHVQNLRKVFRSGATEVTPLNGVNLDVQSRELIAIVGPSGSGKSTLLHLLAALDTPTSGTVYCAGILVNSLSTADLSEFRSRKIGFVWQRHHLLPDFTAAENVAMPLRILGVAAALAAERAREWLAEVGLADRADQPAGQLSGGEQQRVAIARALVNGPAVLLADEPTGDLDEENANAVFSLVERLHRLRGLTSILATHNLALAERVGRLLRLEHGRLEPVEKTKAAREVGGTGAVWAGR